MTDEIVTNADFARGASWIAKCAADWAGSALCPPDDASKPMQEEALKRFRADILARLDLTTKP